MRRPRRSANNALNRIQAAIFIEDTTNADGESILSENESLLSEPLAQRRRLNSIESENSLFQSSVESTGERDYLNENNISTIEHDDFEHRLPWASVNWRENQFLPMYLDKNG